MLSTCAISPLDFSQSMDDRQRDNWTPGKMRHVIAALKDTPVAIVTDRRSGSTLLNVRLIGLTSTISSGDCVIVQGDGPAWPRPTAMRLHDCGVILPLSEDGTNAKWDALDTYREEGSAAIRKAKAERPECDYGKWSAVPGQYKVSWRYDPQSFLHGRNAAFRNPEDVGTRGRPHFAYGDYHLSELQVVSSTRRPRTTS